MPTYKRNKADSGYFNKKNQAPSYTDRIMFKNNTSTQKIQVLAYNSEENIFGSDHRPVILDVQIGTLLKQYVDRQLLMDPLKAMN